MEYNPIKYIGNNIDTDFIHLLLNINSDFNNQKLSKYDEEKIDKSVKMMGGDVNKCRKQRQINKIIKKEFSLEDRYGFSIYYNFEKAFDYELFDILEFKIYDMSSESLIKNNDNPLLIKHIKFDETNKSILKNIAKYNKDPFSIKVIYKSNKEFIHVFLKEYITLWKKNYLKDNNKNYLLSQNHLKKYYIYKQKLIKNYGYKLIKIPLSDREKLDFDLISCIVYEHYIGKINIEFTKLFYDIIHINVLDKEYILLFDGNRLIYGEEDKEITKQKLNFCEYIFLENKNTINYNWKECEEYIYGKNHTAPDNGLTNIIKKINFDLKELGCNNYFSYSICQYIKLKKKKN